ncbi:ATP-binding protein [Amylibacter sp.]|nr:ATP-binding protein [Amylibacter sp.]
MKNYATEDVTPSAVDLIKSISEQGYSLETSIADLIDNSISANASKIEILLSTDNKPFRLFIADDGSGMDETKLKSAIRFPSSSIDEERQRSDLGRFGLGLKSASFSQTRNLTVLSRKKGTTNYSGRTWDVEFLKKNPWKVKINNPTEIQKFIFEYQQLSKEMLGSFDAMTSNTIIIWTGLFKYEASFEKEENCKAALNRELTGVAQDHLGLVFHRFMEKSINPLKIRINNIRVKVFNPFPISEPDFRTIPHQQRSFGEDNIEIEGFVLPFRSIEEEKKSKTIWCTESKSLTDMEGIYVYRSDRIIFFGGWLGLIKKSSKLQLARLKVEIQNKADHLMRINVAKSKVEIPYDLRDGFTKYINDLTTEAKKELGNRNIEKISVSIKEKPYELLQKIPTNKGMKLEINHEFPLIKKLAKSINSKEKSNFKAILRIINTNINKIKENFNEENFLVSDEDNHLTKDELMDILYNLTNEGWKKEHILRIVKSFGYHIDSLPSDVQNYIKGLK